MSKGSAKRVYSITTTIPFVCLVAYRNCQLPAPAVSCFGTAAAIPPPPSILSQHIALRVTCVALANPPSSPTPTPHTRPPPANPPPTFPPCCRVCVCWPQVPDDLPPTTFTAHLPPKASFDNPANWSAAAPRAIAGRFAELREGVAAKKVSGHMGMYRGWGGLLVVQVLVCEKSEGVKIVRVRAWVRSEGVGPGSKVGSKEVGMELEELRVAGYGVVMTMVYVCGAALDTLGWVLLLHGDRPNGPSSTSACWTDTT